MKKIKDEKAVSTIIDDSIVSSKREFSVSDTKKFYCEINNKVLAGLEVTTSNSKSKEKISHIKKEYLDFLLNRLKFKAQKEYDKELKTWTIVIKELNLYGDGYTESSATEDLIDSVIEFAGLYLDRTALFTSTESISKQVFMLKILRSFTDRSSLAKELGLTLDSGDAVK
jgi:hypothetical protein